MFDPISIIFGIAVLIMSVVAHEVSHGYAAEFLGDPTARLQGRLTLNPINHLDPVGSILVPLLTYGIPTLLGASGFIFGWAKPVPYNPYNLRKGRLGEAIVAGAGVFTNALIAIFFALGLRFFGADLPQAFVELAALLIFTNLVLAIFNLIPVPPLDGSKILFSALPYSAQGVQAFLERYGLFILILFIFYGWKFISPLVASIFTLLTGIHI